MLTLRLDYILVRVCGFNTHSVIISLAGVPSLFVDLLPYPLLNELAILFTEVSLLPPLFVKNISHVHMILTKEGVGVQPVFILGE